MYVVTGERMRQIDRFTMDQVGISETTLMENAGTAAYLQIESIVTPESSIAVLIGAGNNGGDGFVIARRLKEAGFDTDVWIIPPLEKIRGTARVHMDIFIRSGHTFFQYEDSQAIFDRAISSSTYIIDTMLGTGVKGALKAPYDRIVEEVNCSRAEVIAVDLPSGLPAEENEPFEQAVKACRTIILQAPKETAFLYPYAEYYGEWTTADIGIPCKAFEACGARSRVRTENEVRASLPYRKADGHKGTYGKGLVIGGSEQMPGAVSLTTRAALRTGIGLVTAALPASITATVTGTATEATCLPLQSNQGEMISESLTGLDLSSYDGAAIGPGMGRSHPLSFSRIFSGFDGLVVIDADGLYHLAEELNAWRDGRGGPTVITPHPGEMARLTGKTIEDVEKNRFSLSRQFASEYKMTVVLKGAYTIVTTPDGRQWVNPTGNPGLAKGGSGDTLTGMILAAGLQTDDFLDGVLNAVYIHGLAADQLIHERDEASITASDVIEQLPFALASLR
ncbi:bifunctional ADP-dependent NAD(P)H-hydrate dehydratase/NAD(P)H-hydrate epimerase [Alteribacter lacisalsi]|uniref:Bifunctional NAD(P)H-hydrate repair enzyme n=1 Tax=Alteribacter lacisalsi TaxID=2045244 RepID=A0A2W0HPH8_9BACI|nr:NAD(P)H-hydrate dehydratase [Alteribacter lacisalsi]PYZ95478.1 bifunctional ADP-dependent NAD(P)H-hydrate dehydratase/NAD(P)H-hydrate epimerase [Alteribacter lacisalsi]